MSNQTQETKDIPKEERHPVVLTDSWTDNPELCYTPHQHYPLAKTHVKLLLKDTDVKVLTKNISCSFRAMSCQAKYCNNPLSAYLLTWENVEIRVALWKTRDGDEIVVEVKRLRGDHISFLTYAHVILDAAQERFDPVEYETQNNSRDLDMQHLKAAELCLRREYSGTGEQQDTEDYIPAIRNIHSLLKDDRIEARITGMRSLGVLVDPRKTGVATAFHVSLAILRGVGPNHESAEPYCEIRDFLISVLQNRDIGGRTSEEARHAGGHNNEVKIQDTVSLMFNLTLVVLEYALEVVVNLNELCGEPGSEQDPVYCICKFVVYVQEVSGRSLLATLVDELGRADEAPHTACRCATVLGLFCTLSDDLLQETIDLNAIEAATSAHTYGASHHAKLDKECNRLLGVLRAT